MFVLNGGTVPARLCSREPLSMDELDEVTLGVGTYNALGGLFTITKRGWIECVAVPWKDTVVVTRPSYLPMFGQPSQQAKCGPLKFGKEEETQ